MKCKHCGLSYGMHHTETLRCPDGDNVFTCEHMDCVGNCITPTPALRSAMMCVLIGRSEIPSVETANEIIGEIYALATVPVTPTPALREAEQGLVKLLCEAIVSNVLPPDIEKIMHFYNERKSLAAAPAPDGDEGCACQRCGNKFKVDIIVPDDVWERIKPTGKPAGAGLLCGHCIISRLEDLGYGAFALSARLLKPTPVGNTLKQLIEDAFVEAKSDEAVIKTLRDILDGYTQATEQRKEN